MRYVIFVVLGTILTAYGLSSGLALPHNIGYLIGWLGVVGSIGAALLQYKYSLPYEFVFSICDWMQSQDRYSLLIPKKRHKKREGVTIVIYERTANGYEQVLCDNHVQADGSVLIEIEGDAFEGKVIIK